jgi:hypothetical protein
MPRSEPLAHGATRFFGARGSVVVERVAPGHLLLTAWGYDDGSYQPPVFARFEDEIRDAGALTLWIDSRHQTGSAHAARTYSRRWLSPRRDQVRGLHVLVGSRLMDMVLSLAIMVFGREWAHSYGTPQELERAMRQLVPGFLRLPVYPAEFAEAPTRR